MEVALSLLDRRKGRKWEEEKEEENRSLVPQADPSLAKKFFVKKEEDPSERKDI